MSTTKQLQKAIMFFDFPNNDSILIKNFIFKPKASISLLWIID